MKNYCLKVMRGHSGMPPDYPTGGMVLFLSMFIFTKYGFIKGGGHQLAHAAIRIIAENGGEFFTHREVDKIIIENGRAKGIRLVDGTEVEATQAVVSTLDPATLCFRLIGEEYLSDKICRRVRSIIRNLGTITWNAWAVHDGVYGDRLYHGEEFVGPSSTVEYLPPLNDTLLLELLGESGSLPAGDFEPLPHIALQYPLFAGIDDKLKCHSLQVVAPRHVRPLRDLYS